MFFEAPHMSMMKRTEQIGTFSGAPTALRARMRLPLYLSLYLPLCLLFIGLAMPAAGDQTDPALDSLFTDLVRTGSQAEAEQLTSEIWSRWIASDGDADADRLMQSGMALMNRGMLAGAEQVFSQLIQDHPDFAEAWNKRATVRFLLGNDAGSRRDIARVIDLEPRHFGALSGLGMINMRSGDLQAALQAFEAALRVNPHLNQAVDVTRQLREQLRGQPL
tara:strand:- start:57 stop:716 length:660 start_codon:yes stop_codon:yes gene_type:complete